MSPAAGQRFVRSRLVLWEERRYNVQSCKCSHGVWWTESMNAELRQQSIFGLSSHFLFLPFSRHRGRRCQDLWRSWRYGRHFPLRHLRTGSQPHSRINVIPPFADPCIFFRRVISQSATRGVPQRSSRSGGGVRPAAEFAWIEMIAASLMFV